jgi:porin
MKGPHNYHYLIMMILWPCICVNGFSQKTGERNTLTGDWGGKRQKMEDMGLTLSLDYTGDGFFDLHGGLQRKGTYLDNIGLALAVDTRKLFRWKGGDIFIYGIADNGGQPSSLVGDAQGVDNIEAPSTVKLYEAWIQQSLFRDRVSLLAGFYDLNSEFQELQSSLVFIHAAQGIGTDFAQSGVNGPSIFPTTTVSIRLKWEIAERFYFQTVVLNGVAGDPNHPNGTRLILDHGYGILSASELQYVIHHEEAGSEDEGRTPKQRLGRLSGHEHLAKLVVGWWLYTASFPRSGYADSIEGTGMTKGNMGGYVNGELKIFKEKGSPQQGLAAFARIGFANDRINRFVAFTGGGLVYTGLIRGRDEDVTGLAFATGYNGRPYMNVLKTQGLTTAAAEWDFELTYLWQISPWLCLQPDVQYIIHPGTDTTVSDALTFDLRLTISF